MLLVKNIINIPQELIIDNVSKNGYEVIRGLIDPQLVEIGIQKMKHKFSPKNDHGSIGIAPSDILNNFQKWSAGSLSAKSDSDARLLRIFYNPLWCEDIYSLHGIFNTLVEVRNVLQGRDLNYAKNIEKNKLYSACRVQFYPRGGGFMQAHTDHVGESNLQKTEVEKFIQIFAVLSKKGKDFERGGGFVISGGRKIYVEDNCELGDIVIYDGSTIHGCEDIDPHLPLDTTKLEGRFVGFATLYKVWE